MNQSGRPVAKAYQRVGGKDWGQLCVIYDDLELPVGVAKLRTEGMGK
jgi:peptidyl-tRNA hydrolase